MFTPLRLSGCFAKGLHLSPCENSHRHRRSKAEENRVRLLIQPCVDTLLPELPQTQRRFVPVPDSSFRPVHLNNGNAHIMKKTKNTSTEAKGGPFKIQGQNTQVIQLQEESVTVTAHKLFVTLGPARLLKGGLEIFAGRILLEIDSTKATPAFFPIVTRLLSPFHGTLDIQLVGNCTEQDTQEAKIIVDYLVNLAIKPAAKK